MSNANLVMAPNSRNRTDFWERFYDFFVGPQNTAPEAPQKINLAKERIALSHFPDLKEFLRPTFR